MNLKQRGDKTMLKKRKTEINIQLTRNCQRKLKDVLEDISKLEKEYPNIKININIHGAFGTKEIR